MKRERALSAVPLPILALLVVALLGQLTWHGLREPPRAEARDLPPPPPPDLLRLGSIAEPVLLGKLLNLWLQAFDNQPGISIPFRQLDYARVRAWLERIRSLDPNGHYPLLAATRLYGEVDDAERKRTMLDFVHQQFLIAPDDNWQWLAHAVFVARHRLKDLPLARRYAADLRRLTHPERVPSWARQMELFVLEEMGELQAARILLGGLIETGGVSDDQERRFLEQRLQPQPAPGQVAPE